MLRQQPHRPPFQPTLPVSSIQPPRILVHRVLRPRPNRALVQLFVDLSEPCSRNRVAHGELCVQRPAGSFGAVQERGAPSRQQGVWLEGAVVGHDAHVELDLLDPSAGLEIAAKTSE